MIEYDRINSDQMQYLGDFMCWMCLYNRVDSSLRNPNAPILRQGPSMLGTLWCFNCTGNRYNANSFLCVVYIIIYIYISNKSVYDIEIIHK